jgi:hypothetical protein
MPKLAKSAIVTKSMVAVLPCFRHVTVSIFIRHRYYYLVTSLFIRLLQRKKDL